MKVEFYYSSKTEPAKQYYCDNKKALELCEELKGKGVDVKVQDCAQQAAAFMTYNAAVTTLRLQPDDLTLFLFNGVAHLTPELRTFL